MRSRPKICCSTCNGSGKVELPAELWATLQFVRRNGDTTAPDVTAKVPPGHLGTRSPTAANNRLEMLRRLGLVERAKSGRRWRYYATKPGEPEAREGLSP